MTEDFAAFFAAVRAAARRHGIKVHVVAGIAKDGTGGQVRVASHGSVAEERIEPKFIERCCDAMGESLESTLERLSEKFEPKAEYLN